MNFSNRFNNPIAIGEESCGDADSSPKATAEHAPTTTATGTTIGSFYSGRLRNTIVKLMRPNDLVIIYEGINAMDHVYLDPYKGIFQNKYGAFHHEDMVGRPFGSKIQSRWGTGYIYALEPTPELWSMGVRTRTQIVNELDSSVVLLNLDLFPGCRVIESGTGSGCMSIQLARAVTGDLSTSPHKKHKNSGHVFTFEYNAIRAQTAQAEFAKLNLDSVVTCTCRDAYKEGFRLTDESTGQELIADGSIDAVFLDLPQPWSALDKVFDLLKPSRPICCYSPCMEQVMRTCDKLREMGFYGIRMVEARHRPFDAKYAFLENLDLGNDRISDVNDQFDGLSSGSAASTTHQIPTTASDTIELLGEDAAAATNSPSKRRRTETPQIEGEVGGGGDDSASSRPADPHSSRPADPHSSSSDGGDGHQKRDYNERPQTFEERNPNRPKDMSPTKMLVGVPAAQFKSHSAFLTFAYKPTNAVVESMRAQQQKPAATESSNSNISEAV